MARSSAVLRLVAAALLVALVQSSSSAYGDAAGDEPASYIIHVSSYPKSAQLATPLHWYSHTLRSLPRHLRRPAPRILYAYARSTYGFAARLTPAQAAALRRVPSVLAVLPDRARHTHTTHTPTFLHLSNVSGIWPNSDYASNVVVGVLDTGVWPHNHPSFSDDGLDPAPSSWAGTCESGPGFPASACNSKLIGARFFYRGYEASMGHPIDPSRESKSPLDTEGHGTHTSSTIAGATVPDAGLFTYARGVARGMATKARLAVYKICWSPGCFDSDILAAMDAAIDDGVDVISLSVGAGGYAPAFYRDSIAIGAFGAARHGVVVSCSAGNSGPGSYTAVNVAPWIITVGASTVDRDFPADVVLGNGAVYGGVSLYAGDPLNSTGYPLVHGADAGSRLCITGRLEPSKVAGKIVVCDRGSNARVEKGAAVKIAGGVGMIMANTAESGEELLADAHFIAATMVGQIAGDKIRAYVRSNQEPTATINFRGTVIGLTPAAPKVASFSSRGPNFRAREILKPDVIAPGVNILAGWTGATAPTDLDIDPRRVAFNIISGTSMSCPHVSGIAALLRKAHPEWSTAAIKSALMTTAYNVDDTGATIKDLATGEESTPFVRGAGHVNPNAAMDPGLVYDIELDDYVAFLCSIGYGPSQIAVFTKDERGLNCSATALASPGDLNYPAFSVVFSSSKVVTYKRVVRNVGGSAVAEYTAEVSTPAGVEVSVSPWKLVFGAKGQSLEYEITFTSTADQVIPGFHSYGWISWRSSVYSVRSPIAVSWQPSYAVV